ncbi:XrtA system polysaccharide chain length determinant, partial [Oleiphilus sp. HI0086]|uniref:XrtA system polysaccharide chain length determinant n=1 Tax=Oleiphilus sp. HI0086 TaxID=1822260 RepID=UPI0007C285EE
LWQRKFWCLLGFARISFTVLFVWMVVPSKFQTSATIFADNQNILKPLLDDQAAQSKVQNHTKIVKDTIHSPRILKQVVDNLYGVQGFESAEELGQAINSLREKVLIKGLGAGYIKISYSDTTAEESYRVINEVVDVFIRASTDEQRTESREAFLFIDNQVKQYKDQLLLAEERLKNFRSQNFDGRDGDVDSSISRIRSQIEELKISIDEDKTSITATKKQLNNESEFSSQKYTADVYGERLKSLETTRNNLLLTYTEDYPDVVSLTYQIDDIRRAMKESDENKRIDGGQAKGEQDAVLNPLYQELRSRLSNAITRMQTKEKRLSALQGLMDKEFERRKRIAERGAEEAELTRDYTVTKRIYEDMLERKEKARLSMTLNVEGQGVTYRIQEPALPPLNPVGLRFLHFVLLGPIAGFLAIIGLAVVYIFVDQRIRFPEKLHEFDVATLAVIPHIKTSFTKRVVRVDMIICVVLSILIMGAYVGLAFAAKVGMI